MPPDLTPEQKQEREEHVRQVTTGRVRLVPGQIWEKVTGPIPDESKAQKYLECGYEPGCVKRYELEEASQFSIWQRLARLRNLETGGIARIYCDQLEKGESLAPRSHWRLVDG